MAAVKPPSRMHDCAPPGPASVTTSRIFPRGQPHICTWLCSCFLQIPEMKFPSLSVFRWSLQRGFVPLPKSISPERQRENFAVFDFCIPEAEMRELDALEAHLITG